MIQSCRPAFALLLSIGVLSPTANGAEPDTADAVEQGRQIYLNGVLPSGAKLSGLRFDSSKAEGQDVACVKCHRPSGMGGIEGDSQVPPISAPFLFNREQQPLALLDTRSPRDLTRARESYTDETLAKAVTAGIGLQGKPLNPLMPRYELKPEEMKALTAYLRQLSNTLSPGVTDKAVRFATIITPEIDSKRREVMVQMMRNAFHQRNYSQHSHSGQMRMPLQLIPHTDRNWDLAVWELTGAPETWAAQLDEKYRKEPVFAVLSGLSDGSWAPIDAFCAQQKLPCLFPSTPLPGDGADFYSLYFSRGVLLEAQVLAKYLQSTEKSRPRRVVQVRVADPVGQAASAALAQALSGTGQVVEERIFDAARPEKSLLGVSGSDAIVAWLRPKELEALKQSVKRLPAPSYFSARLASNIVDVLPQTWDAQAHLVYPYELGVKRERNLTTFSQWLPSYGHQLIDENFQSEVFFSLLLLTDLTIQMLDNNYRDYLIERAEDMLGQGANVSSYPRLNLGVGQRFGSKGAYIAHFGKSGKLEAESEWIVP